MYTHSPLAVVSRRKAGVLKHLGILLPDGRVAHCAPGRGEHLSTAEEFAAGKDVTIERVLPHGESAPTLARIVATLRAPNSYDLLANNCEAFANRMIGQKDESQQLQGVGLILGLFLLYLVAAK